MLDVADVSHGRVLDPVGRGPDVVADVALAGDVAEGSRSDTLLTSGRGDDRRVVRCVSGQDWRQHSTEAEDQGDGDCHCRYDATERPPRLEMCHDFPFQGLFDRQNILMTPRL